MNGILCEIYNRSIQISKYIFGSNISIDHFVRTFRWGWLSTVSSFQRTTSMVGRANFSLFFIILLAIALFCKSSIFRLLLVLRVPTIESMHFSVILLWDKLTCSIELSHRAFAMIWKPSSDILFFDMFRCLMWLELNLMHLASSYACISLKFLFVRSNSPFTAVVLNVDYRSYFFFRPKLLLPTPNVDDFLNLF